MEQAKGQITTMEEREETFYQILQKSWRSSVLILTFLELGDCPTGQIFNLHIPAGIPFRGLVDMVMKMDRIYDLLDYPQAEFETRSWEEGKEKSWEGTLLEGNTSWIFGEEAMEQFRKLDFIGKNVMYAETRFRRNASWQGILRLGGRRVTYRSTLEFLHCVVDYLRMVQEGDWSARPRTKK